MGQASKSSSCRCVQTLLSLSDYTGMHIDNRFIKGDEKTLANHIKDNISSGGVLITWEHRKLQEIANHLLGSKNAPTYDDDAYDIVWEIKGEKRRERRDHEVAGRRRERFHAIQRARREGSAVVGESSRGGVM